MNKISTVFASARTTVIDIQINYMIFTAELCARHELTSFQLK